MKAETKFSLKDKLFSREKVEYFADLFANKNKSFDKKRFVRNTLKKFPKLELKQRITHMTEVLHGELSKNYATALKSILKSLPPALDPTKTDDDFGDFIMAPIGNYIATNGCNEKCLDISLKALKETTQRFTAEDPIRYFINAFPEQTLRFLEQCAKDSNYHVRRLASEGTRPKLPWCQNLIIDFKTPLPILDRLHADPTRYVTRSVANHMNDISKIDPRCVFAALDRWKKAKSQSAKEFDFIVRHSLRTLVKRGHPRAMKAVGFGTKPDVTISKLKTKSKTVKVGDAFEFSFQIKSNKKQKLMIDYVMEFAAAAGKKPSQKVFKIKQFDLDKDEVIQIEKRHPLKLMTTRRLYEGPHRITLQINGISLNSLAFELRS